MKKLKIIISVVTASLIAAACGAGSESSETTERTRNTTVSPFAFMVMYVAGDDNAGRSKIYEYRFNSAGIPTVTELVNTAQDGNTGITGVGYDARDNTLYWAQQEASGIKIRGAIAASGATSDTLYSIDGGYPHTLALSTDYQHIFWSGQTGSGTQIWRGDKLSGPATVVKTGDVRGLSPNENVVLAFEGSNIYSYPVGGLGRTRLVHTTTGTDGWATMYDSITGDLYYVSDFVRGSNNIVKVSGGVETVVASASKRVISMAMTSAGNIVWADGPRPSRLDAVEDSQIHLVNPSNPELSQTLSLEYPLKVTSLWIVEAPTIVMDPEIEGGGTVGTEYFCNTGLWSPEYGGSRRSQSPLNLGYSIEWHQDGEVIPSATDDVFVPEFGGRLKCVVTASNTAGTGTAQSLELDVVGPSASTLAPSGSDSTTTSTVVGESPTTTVAPRYKSISVKWSYNSSKKLLTGTFKKVSGARTYSMTMSGATRKTVKCTTSGTKVTCKATLKKGANVITVNAKNSAKAIVAQKRASKTVR